MWGWILLAALMGSAGLIRRQAAQADEKGTISDAPVNGAGISLTDPADARRATHVKYSLQIKGTLATPSTNGTTKWDLNSSAAFEFDQRRFSADSVGPFALRAVRRFQEAETSSSVGKDHRNTVVLPTQSRLIQIYGNDLQLVQLSPDVRLTRPQLDLLQFPCDPLAVTGLLPERNLKDQTEKWNADAWVVPMLTGIDASVTQSATCRLKSLSESEAVITFDCEGTGAVTGSPTEIRLTGEMVLDRKNSLIRRLRATMEEKREPGTVSPGLDVIVEIQWAQEVAEPDSPLPHSIPDSHPVERQLLLTLVTPWRVLLLHDRKWHIFHETPELVMLRMLHKGSLLAQCNIASAPLMTAGRYTPEVDYLAEVERAVNERGGRINASEVDPDQNGWRIHHIKATGEANKKRLAWDYYLCTTKAGEQISLVFSHAEEDDAVFSGVPEQMLKSLTIRSTRPKIALPR